MQKIEDVDGHFFRIHETGSVVEYTEDGMIINKQVTISPEAYNEMGKEQLEQKLNDIKKCPNADQRKKDVKTLVKDYESDDFEELAEKYVQGTLTDEEKIQFDAKMQVMAVRRKDQFFRDTAKFKETSNYRENITNKETEIAGGKNIEAWKEEQRKLDEEKKTGKITTKKYDEKQKQINEGLKQAEHARELRKTIDKYVQNPDSEFMNELNRIKTEVLNETQRNQKIDDLVKRHRCPELTDYAKDYASGNINAEQQAKFDVELDKAMRRNMFNDYVKSRANGKTESEWQQTLENLEKQYDNLPEHAKEQEAVKQRFQVGRISNLINK